MSKKGYIPSRDADFNSFFKNIIQYVAAKTSGSTPEWKHIPQEDQDELNMVYAGWFTAYNITLKPHTHEETKEKNRVKKTAEKALREFVNSFLRYSKAVTDADRDNMRIPNRDNTRTPQKIPTELVEFLLKIMGIRQVHVHFKVLGAANRAKPKGYDGAVIIWGVLDKPPARPEDLTEHILASSTPYTINFDETERGKIVYVCLCWQNGKGKRGPWSEIQWTYVP